jgi:hypothetical protein
LTAAIQSHAAAIGVTRGFTAAQRMSIQDECIKARRYTIIGRLTAVLFEGQRELRGLSQSKARYSSPGQEKVLSDAMKPFSESQTSLWYSVCLDWLTHKNAPVLAVSHDRKDLLLPFGLTPLPKIPDPRWVPQHAQSVCPVHTVTGCPECVAPRIPQLLTGCPVVGDRVKDKITARDGREYGIIHPVLELAVMLGGAQGGFGRIRGGVDPADGTHLSLLLDDSNPEQMSGWFVSGRFQFGG